MLLSHDDDGLKEVDWQKYGNAPGDYRWETPATMTHEHVSTALLALPAGEPFRHAYSTEQTSVLLEKLMIKVRVKANNVLLADNNNEQGECHSSLSHPCIHLAGIVCMREGGEEVVERLLPMQHTVYAMSTSTGVTTMRLQAYSKIDHQRAATCVRDGRAGVALSVRGVGSNAFAISDMQASLVHDESEFPGGNIDPTTTTMATTEEEELPSNNPEEGEEEEEDDDDNGSAIPSPEEEPTATAVDGHNDHHHTSSTTTKVVSIVVAVLVVIGGGCMLAAFVFALIARTHAGRMYLRDLIQVTIETADDDDNGGGGNLIDPAYRYDDNNNNDVGRKNSMRSSLYNDNAASLSENELYKGGPPLVVFVPRVAHQPGVVPRYHDRVCAAVTMRCGEWRRFDAGVAPARSLLQKRAAAPEVLIDRATVRPALLFHDDDDDDDEKKRVLTRPGTRPEFAGKDEKRRSLVFREVYYDENEREVCQISEAEVRTLLAVKKACTQQETADSECTLFLQRLLGLQVPRYSSFHTEVLTPNADCGTLYDVLATRPAQLRDEAAFLALLQIGAAVSYLHRRNFAVCELGLHSVAVRRETACDGTWMRVRCLLTEVTRARVLHHESRQVWAPREPVSVETSAPEVLRHGLFSPLSDAYSYAHLCWQLLAIPSADDYTALYGSERFLVPYPRLLYRVTDEQVNGAALCVRDAVCRKQLRPFSDGDTDQVMKYSSPIYQLAQRLVAPLSEYQADQRMTIDEARCFLVKQLKAFKRLRQDVKPELLASMCSHTLFDTARNCVLEPGGDHEVTIEVSLLSSSSSQRLGERPASYEEKDASAHGSDDDDSSERALDDDDDGATWSEASFATVPHGDQQLRDNHLEE